MSLTDTMAMPTRHYNEKFKQLCAPIFQFFGLDQAGYVEMHNDGRLLNIHTHADWLEHCIEEKYYIDDPHMVSPDNMGSGFLSWATVSKKNYSDNIIQDSVENYEMCHGITFIKKSDTYYKAFGFGTDKDNFQVYNKLLNNLDYLKKFISYLDQQLESVRRHFEANYANFSELKGNDFFEQEGIIPIQKNNKLEQYRFLKQLGCVSSDLQNVNLTIREIQCIKLYLAGKSATQTAKLLSLSSRTIESHMENIKRKLNLRFKRDLFNKAEILREMEIL